MGAYAADVIWTLREGDDFRGGRYGRGHVLRFDGGAEVAGSASPLVVGAWADPAAVDPEEMFVAALSSCHMLFFLHLAREAGFEVVGYRDHAVGHMAEIAPGRQAMTEVVLRPRIAWRGDGPSDEERDRLHHAAHEACFIANSVHTQVRVENA